MAHVASRMRGVLATVVLSAAVAAANAATPTETVSSTVDAVISVLQSADASDDAKKRRVKSIISNHFDFRAMANRVLATNWKSATKKQRTRFTSLFKELLSNTYWVKISGYEDEAVEYIGERMRNDKLATVKTLIKTPTVDIPVDYKMYRRDDGGWYAYDVVIEQVSLVRNYRGTFQQIVRDVGIDGLITQLGDESRAVIGTHGRRRRPARSARAALSRHGSARGQASVLGLVARDPILEIEQQAVHPFRFHDRGKRRPVVLLTRLTPSITTSYAYH